MLYFCCFCIFIALYLYIVFFISAISNHTHTCMDMHTYRHTQYFFLLSVCLCVFQEPIQKYTFTISSSALINTSSMLFFRLVVVAEKQAVYNKFPIPLINRLEKHLLTVTNVLTKNQKQILEKLDDWVHKFANSTKSW